jgi:hypothetical protein
MLKLEYLNPLERNLMVTGTVITVLGLLIPAVTSIVQSIGPDLIKALAPLLAH